MRYRFLGARIVLLALVVFLAIRGTDEGVELSSRAVHAEPMLMEMRRLAEAATTVDRSALVRAKMEALSIGDPGAIAAANAPLSTEALTRAASVMHRWLARIDPETRLLPTSMEPDGQQFIYGDTASDLFPHVGIATRLLAKDRFDLVLDMLASERRLTRGVPEPIDLRTDRETSIDPDEAIFGAAEYVKDGLLPLIERIGPDPWLARAREVTDAILSVADVPTPNHGKIPANSTEVNGDMLQVLSRLYWATREMKYLEAADRIALTYVEDVLPKTSYLPPNQWDFVDGEPIGRRRLRLSDHGNEVLSGLIEWHLIETALERPGVTTHRQTIRRMLDRILESGRNEDGMWLRVIEIPSGRVEQPGLTDSWGYVFQAFLAQAAIERRLPGGDTLVADRYDEAARTALQALPRYQDYPWEGGKMDGYADALEGALYLLDELTEPLAADWLDDQMEELFKFQQPDGTVLERDLDGNFIRTSLLYSAWLTRGTRLSPWDSQVHLGAALDGECTVYALSAEQQWDGRMVFDVARHRLHLGLPFDYPRLNKWPEWFVAEPERTYRLSGMLGERTLTGAELAAGVSLALVPGQSGTLRVCAA